MISNLSMAGMIFTLGVCFIPVVAIPVFFEIKLRVKNSLNIFILGMGGYALTQILIRTPLLNMIYRKEGFLEFTMNYFLLYAFLLALSAALFETVGRVLVVRASAKRGLDFNRSFLLGAGHGVIEAVITVGMASLNNIRFATMINNGEFESMVTAGGVTAENMEHMKDIMINTHSILFFSSGFERFCAICVQITLTILLVRFVQQKNIIKGSIFCIIFQTIVSFISVLLGKYFGNIPAIIFMTVTAGIGVFYIIKSRKKIEPFKI